MSSGLILASIKFILTDPSSSTGIVCGMIPPNAAVPTASDL